MFTVQSIHISFEIWGVIFCIIAALCMALSKSFGKEKRRLLAIMQASGAILLGMDAVAWTFRGVDGAWGFYGVRISNFIVFEISDVIMMLFHTYVLSSVQNSSDENVAPFRKRLGYVMGIVGVTLVILSQFNHMYYWFDKSNLYHRNIWYPICLIIPLIGGVIDVTLIIQYRKRMHKILQIAMASYLVLPIAGAIALLFYYGISFVNIGITISLIFMFVTEILEQNQIFLEKEKEVYDMKVNMMLSQIGPHFIYNTLNTIGYLCKKDPDEAEKTVLQFSKYLRSNLNSISAPELIPFQKELEHVKNYIAIEQKRFGNRIQVEYQIEETHFVIPALSMQPLIENAIRHGLLKKKTGGTLWIQSRVENDFYIIHIQDDGVGFDVATLPDDGKGHIGIWNVKNRLRAMSHGDLQIISEIGCGTTAILQIPIE